MTLDPVLRSSNSDSRGDEAHSLHEDLERLVRLRKRYDEALGRLAIAIQITEGWRFLGFASFAEYCEERLGMEVTHVERLAARARKAIYRSRWLAPSKQL
jgi:hypothetical protein